MCGIAGIWGQAEAPRLRAMAQRLAHRGPDDEGVYVDRDAGLGLVNRRLSIIDLAGGHQPIANADGSIVTVFNGEIYNYRELRDELIGQGCPFATQSDTEVIVHLYARHGVDFVTRLRGMFAIALWDRPERQLVLVRDRAGKKPIYYAASADEFRFASEIKALVATAPEPPQIDHQAVADYLAWMVVPAPGTIYREFRAVEPGQIMVVRDRRPQPARRYWRLCQQPKERITRAEAIDRIDAGIRESVRLRLRSDVPVGVFLSGGIDSGIITAMAAAESAHPVTTLSAGFDDATFDERPLARLVAERYGTDHHEILIRPDAADVLPKVALAYDQPFADSSAIPSYYVAAAAREHVKVVLNGDGGDEVFAGYRRHVAARLLDRLALFDNAVWRPGWRALAGVLPTPRSFRTAYALGHRMVRGMGMAPGERLVAWAVDGFTLERLRYLSRSPEWLDGVQPPSRFVGDSGGGRLDAMLKNDFDFVLPNELLVKMDIATMAHGLEARSPLLDHVLVDSMARLPENLKLSGRQTKPLLRSVAARYLPEAVRVAPKRGFEIPRLKWLRGPLSGMRDDVILADTGLLADLFDRGRLERLVRDSAGLDPARWGTLVWILLMLGVWDRHVRSAG